MEDLSMRAFSGSRSVGVLCWLALLGVLLLLIHVSRSGLPAASPGGEAQEPVPAPLPGSTVPSPPVDPLLAQSLPSGAKPEPGLLLSGEKHALPPPDPGPFQLTPPPYGPKTTAPSAPPPPLAAHPGPDWTAEALIAHLDSIRTKKAELDKQEKEVVAILRVKLRDLKENLQKRGISAEPEETVKETAKPAVTDTIPAPVEPPSRNATTR
jgi:hypothetical protein